MNWERGNGGILWISKPINVLKDFAIKCSWIQRSVVVTYIVFNIVTRGDIAADADTKSLVGKSQLSRKCASGVVEWKQLVLSTQFSI